MKNTVHIQIIQVKGNLDDCPFSRRTTKNYEVLRSATKCYEELRSATKCYEVLRSATKNYEELRSARKVRPNLTE